jgi:hypothetical protein
MQAMENRCVGGKRVVVVGFFEKKKQVRHRWTEGTTLMMVETLTRLKASCSHG